MIEILFENEDFLACIKPVGVPSQCDGAEDAVKLLKEQTGDEIYPVHGGKRQHQKSSPHKNDHKKT